MDEDEETYDLFVDDEDEAARLVCEVFMDAGVDFEILGETEHA